MLMSMATLLSALQAEPLRPVPPGGIRDFLSTRTDESLKDENERRAVMAVREELPSTADYLGMVVARPIEADIKTRVLQDLRFAAWADLNCVPGEAAVVGTGLKRARRFKEIPLPALVLICRGTGGDYVDTRVREHALNTARQIVTSSPHAAALKDRLAKLMDRGSLEILFNTPK